MLFKAKQMLHWGFGRYLLVLLILAGTLLFGRNFEGNSAYQANLQENRFSDAEEGIYYIDEGEDELVLKDKVSISPDAGYRIFFDVAMEAGAISGSDSNNIDLALSVGDTLGRRVSVCSHQLVAGERRFGLEGVFVSDDNYRDLVFSLNNTKFEGVIRIENIQIYALNIKTRAEEQGLKKTTVGATDFNKVILSNWPEEAESEYTFRKKYQKIGQIFTANSKMISAIDLKLKFIGTGGEGDYYLELYEYYPESSTISERLAYFNFDRESATTRLLTSSTERTYRIPLAANLVIGKQYVVCIANDKVEFNPLNTLSVLGQDNQFENGRIFLSNRRHINNLSGSLSFKLYGVNYSEYGGEMIPTGAIIQDLGKGEGLYTYKQRGDISDFLDISEIGVEKNNGAGIFYDNNVGGIASDDSKDASVIYKFNTIYPFGKFSISADQPGGNFTNSKFYLSFDDNNWQEVQMKIDKNSPKIASNRFEIIASGDGKQNAIYIKITCDQESKKKKHSEAYAARLFGIKNIDVEAELQVK